MEINIYGEFQIFTFIFLLCHLSRPCPTMVDHGLTIKILFLHCVLLLQKNKFAENYMINMFDFL